VAPIAINSPLLQDDLATGSAAARGDVLTMNSPLPVQMGSTARASLPILLSLAAGVFALELWLFQPIVAAYFPSLDELPLQVASTSIGGPVQPGLWFTEGFRGYFQPIPEWPVAGTDFWRPLVNALYWLKSQVFAGAWGNELLVGYLAHAMVAALVCYMARSIFQLPTIAVLAAVAIAVMNPAFLYHSPLDPYQIPRAIQYPNYQVEVINALLMLLACLAFMRRRFGLFSLIATLALFLKETSVTLPLSALVLASAWTGPDRWQSWRNFSWLALPLVIWIAAKALFRQFGDAAGVLAASAHLAWLIRPVRNALMLPTGLYQHGLGDTRGALAAHDWHAALVQGGELLTNLAWWIALVVVIVAAVMIRRAAPRVQRAPPWLIGLVFALGNLLGVLLLPTAELRYAYFWFALGPAALFAVLVRRSGGIVIACLLSAALLCFQAGSLGESLSPQSLAHYRLARQAARQLTELLARLPPSVATVYVVDDLVVQSSSPDYFARFAGFKGRVVLVNNLMSISGCVPAARNGTDDSGVRRYLLTRDGPSTTLDYHAPECFEKAWNSLPLQGFDGHNGISRGSSLHYYFPELSVPRKASPSSNGDYDPGRHWLLRSDDASCMAAAACVWLGLDAVNGRYYELNP
jgi:hypothetical protein